MITAGVDIGSLSAEAVILSGDGDMLWSVIRTTPDIEMTARKVLEVAVDGKGLSLQDIKYVVATGYGRVATSFADSHLTEISCHARGAQWFFPGVRTILDMGGEDCKAIRCDENGKVVNFIMNDKCAAGTGRYLERVASTLGVSLDQIGELSLQAKDTPAEINRYCAVFAQSDVLALLRQGRPVNDILAGACDAIVARIVGLLKRLSIEEVLTVTGGVAKNIGVVRRLEEQLGLRVQIAFEPQIVGALGASLFARDRLERQQEGC